MLQKLGEDPYGIFGVVLTPTRELAIQLSEQFDALGSRMGLRQCVVIGGMDMMKQSLALGRRPHIIIATPGRLRDHLQGPSPPNLSKAKFLVLDEADRLLSPTFEGELRVILNALPSKRQSLLFSATMTGNLRRLERLGLMNPVTYDLTREATIPATLSQEYLFVPNQMKVCFLAQTLRQTLHRKVLGTGDEVKNADEEEEEDHRLARSVIVFAGSCKKCQEVTETLLELKVECVSLHSMMTQRRRLAALGKFKSSQCHVLVSTDVSSRGLDIPDVDLVINFDIPRVATDYVHRVGRTARAGRRGRAISLVSQFDVELVHSIEAYTRSKLDLCEDVLEKDVVKLISSVNKASRIAKMRMLEHGFDEQLEKRSKRSKKKRSSSAD
jgi:ATP-dependent RNA helicase DDX49/DBP8